MANTKSLCTGGEHEVPITVPWPTVQDVHPTTVENWTTAEIEQFESSITRMSSADFINYLWLACRPRRFSWPTSM